MNRLENKLQSLKQNNKKGLILYISAGDPDMATTLEIMKALADNGAACIELGVPFSDPIADGPVIQRASQRALKNNVNLDDILNLVSQFRKSSDTPVVLMGYYNSFYQYGLKKFTSDLQKAGGDGLIIADLPWEESEELEEYCAQYEISLVQLLAPDMKTERTSHIIDSARGFIYFVSNYGTTGTDLAENKDLASLVESVRKETDLPIAIGFGISSPEKAAAAVKHGDCVIVGSWLIAELEKANDKPGHAAEFTKKLVSAIE